MSISIDVEKLDKILADRKIPFATRSEVIREATAVSETESRMAHRMRESLNAAAKAEQDRYKNSVLSTLGRLGIKVPASGIDKFTLDRMFAEATHPELQGDSGLKLRFSLKAALRNVGCLK